MRLLLLAILILFNSVDSISQRSGYADSMLRIIKATKNDSLRVYKMNELSFFYIFNDAEKAKNLIEKGIHEAKKYKTDHGLAQLYLSKGIFHDVQNQKDSAQLYFDKGLDLSREKNYQEIEMLALNNLGMFNWSKGEFNEALSYFFRALEINKKHFPDRLESKANYYNNIGLVYQELRQFTKAITYHQSSLKIRKNERLVKDQAISHANLGLCYLETKHYKESEKNFLLALQQSEQVENWRMYYALHDNLGSFYRKTNNLNKAITYFEKAITRPDDLGVNPKSDLSICTNLATLYNQINKPEQAAKYIDKSFDLLKKNPELKNFSSGLYLAEAEYNYLTGNLIQARASIEQYKEINDSIFSSKNALALADWEKKFEELENNLTIANQKRIIQDKELKVQQTRLWLISSSGILILLIVILFALLRRKAAIAEKAELQMNISKQEQLVKSQEERLRISRELHDNIGSYLTLMSATAEELSNSGESGKKIENLKDNLSMSMRELRRTVWLFNQRSANIDEIVIKVRDFFKPIIQNGKNIQIHADSETEEIVLSDVQTTHVFRIIQEAVNNALKHAKCTSITISFFTNSDKELSFTIADDGNGFDEHKIKEGNGLKNMQSRVLELNGKMNIVSSPSGTLISCTFHYENTQQFV